MKFDTTSLRRASSSNDVLPWRAKRRHFDPRINRGQGHPGTDHRATRRDDLRGRPHSFDQSLSRSLDRRLSVAVVIASDSWQLKRIR
jgi:hypothetical protein